MKCPCQGCTKRNATCHSEGNCPPYDEYRVYARGITRREKEANRGCMALFYQTKGNIYRRKR